MSWRISASSGSSAAGSILTSVSWRSPDILTCTMPPPAEASTVSCLSCSCAAAISICACWSCFIILLRFGCWAM